MRTVDIRYFGIVSGLSVGLILTMFSILSKIDIIYIKSLGKLPIYLGLIPAVGIIVYTLVNKKAKRRTLNWMYLGVVGFSFIYIFSKLEWIVECCPDKYESIYDWNATKGLSWLVNLPLTFFIILIQGILFDICKGRR